MKLELKHILPYWEHQIKVQYEGILNGSELSKYKRKYYSDSDAFSFFNEDNDREYNPPEEIKGLKIGFIKEISVFLNHQNFRLGVKNHGLKNYGSFMPDFKLILHPLSEYCGKTKAGDVMKKLDCDLNTVYDIWELQETGNLGKISYNTYDILCRNKIDMFGLIDKGLAKDINTLNE